MGHPECVVSDAKLFKRVPSVDGLVFDWDECRAYCDVEIVAADDVSQSVDGDLQSEQLSHRFVIHSLLLASFSDLMLTTLRDAAATSSDATFRTTIKLDNVDVSTVENVVEFLYNGWTCCTSEDAVARLIAALRSLGLPADQFQVTTTNTTASVQPASRDVHKYAAPALNRLQDRSRNRWLEDISVDEHCGSTREEHAVRDDSRNGITNSNEFHSVPAVMTRASKFKSEYNGSVNGDTYLESNECDNDVSDALKTELDDQQDDDVGAAQGWRNSVAQSDSKYRTRSTRVSAKSGGSKKHRKHSRSRRADIDIEPEKAKKRRGARKAGIAVRATGEDPFASGSKSSLKCKHCPLTLASKELMTLHVNEQHVSCHLCEKSFPERPALNRHLLRHSLPKGSVKCFYCDGMFAGLPLRKEHTERDHPEKMVKCLSCDKTFVAVFLMNYHLRKHVPAMKYKCTLCDRSYVRRDDLRRHMTRHDQEQGVDLAALKCNHCGQSFRALTGLTRHECGRPRQVHVCDLCRKEFSSLNSLNSHIWTHKKEFSCAVCSKQFPSKRSLDAHHTNVHSDERKFICSTCGKAHKTKGNLVVHAKTHSDVKDYACSECDFRTHFSKTLKYHMRRHTGEKPIQCQACGKHFRTPFGLKNHMLTHTGERPYPCTHCEKRFTTKPKLTDHTRIHTGEKPFSCKLCSMRCRTSDLLYHHMKTHAQQMARAANNAAALEAVHESEQKSFNGENGSVANFSL